MTTRLALIPAAALLALGVAAPALAQAPDFGDDASPWSSDGECDDPRFQGAGMAQPPLADTDVGHDATDCRAAFQAGSVALAAPAGAAAPVRPGKGGAAPAAPAATTAPALPVAPAAPAAPVAAPAPPPAAAAPAAVAPTAATAVNFGDDSSEWARDGECDDRRFAGPGVAASLSWSNAGRDATDCRAALDGGQARLWDLAEARAALSGAAVDFGSDAGQFAGDGECDDVRFEGLGMAYGVGPELVGQDAGDCSRLRDLGLIGLRDY